MLTGASATYDLQVLIRDALLNALRTTRGGPVDGCVVLGDIAWDDCNCGQLYVSTSRTYLTNGIPTAASLSTPCQAGQLGVDLIATVVRCAPSPQGSDVGVPCVQLEDAARVLAEDTRVAIETLACYLEQLEDENVIADHLMLDAQVRGPAGGCVGVEVRFTVALVRGIA